MKGYIVGLIPGLRIMAIWAGPGYSDYLPPWSLWSPLGKICDLFPSGSRRCDTYSVSTPTGAVLGHGLRRAQIRGDGRPAFSRYRRKTSYRRSLVPPVTTHSDSPPFRRQKSSFCLIVCFKGAQLNMFI